MINFTIDKIIEDERGKMVIFSYGNKQVNFIEIKKDYFRGGHYHEFLTSNIIITGKLEYKEKNLDSELESVKIFSAPAIIVTPPRHAHLLRAIENSIIVEVMEKPYNVTNYPEYRKVIEGKMRH